MGDTTHVMLVFYEGWVCICFIHELLECLCLIVNYELTPSGHLVDRLPYPYGWVDGVQE